MYTFLSGQLLRYGKLNKKCSVWPYRYKLLEREAAMYTFIFGQLLRYGKPKENCPVCHISYIVHTIYSSLQSIRNRHCSHGYFFSFYAYCFTSAVPTSFVCEIQQQLVVHQKPTSLPWLFLFFLRLMLYFSSAHLRTSITIRVMQSS